MTITAINTAPPTRVIRIDFKARTLAEYSETMVVPLDATEAEIMALLDRRYELLDGSDFLPDTEYFERGVTEFESAGHEDSTPLVIATRVDGKLHMSYRSPEEAQASKGKLIDVFPHNVLALKDAVDGTPVVGYSDNGMAIHEPRKSSCGRFDVDPTANGLTADQADALERLNIAVGQVAEAMLAVGTKAILTNLSLPIGSRACAFASDKRNVDSLREMLTQYAVDEIMAGRADA